VAAYTRTSPARGGYNRTAHRLRELEKIISYRYNAILPITEDADVFLFTAAKLLRRNLEDRCGLPSSDDVLDRLAVWAERWAHFTPVEHLRKMVALAMRRPILEKADALGALLSLTYADRQYLNITTIGACDVSKAERQSLSKQKKRDRDRIRAAEKRRLAGVRPRATSLSATRPWEADAISRRTWERRQKRRSRCR
jgi:hypothetical protein